MKTNMQNKKRKKEHEKAKQLKTHTFKNDNENIKTKTKTQIPEERCKLSSGQYCIICIYIYMIPIKCKVLFILCRQYMDGLIHT